MEDTLRDTYNNEKETGKSVLILVLMEDTLRASGLAQGYYTLEYVLILVLMEDTLRAV